MKHWQSIRTAANRGLLLLALLAGFVAVGPAAQAQNTNEMFLSPTHAWYPGNVYHAPLRGEVAKVAPAFRDQGLLLSVISVLQGEVWDQYNWGQSSAVVVEHSKELSCKTLPLPRERVTEGELSWWSWGTTKLTLRGLVEQSVQGDVAAFYADIVDDTLSLATLIEKYSLGVHPPAELLARLKQVTQTYPMKLLHTVPADCEARLLKIFQAVQLYAVLDLRRYDAVESHREKTAAQNAVNRYPIEFLASARQVTGAYHRAEPWPQIADAKR